MQKFLRGSVVVASSTCLLVANASCQRSGGQPPATAGAAAAASGAASEAVASTKLESFRPVAGSTSIFAYTDVGKIGPITVDARQLRSGSANEARGLLVDIEESQYRQAGAFVDADEIAELLKGIDALLEVSDNPTKFERFEVRYVTRGSLELIAFNGDRSIRYSVKAGRITKASTFLDRQGMVRFKELIEKAQAQLQAIGK